MENPIPSFLISLSSARTTSFLFWKLGNLKGIFFNIFLSTYFLSFIEFLKNLLCQRFGVFISFVFMRDLVDGINPDVIHSGTESQPQLIAKVQEITINPQAIVKSSQTSFGSDVVELQSIAGSVFEQILRTSACSGGSGGDSSVPVKWTTSSSECMKDNSIGFKLAVDCLVACDYLDYAEGVDVYSKEIQVFLKKLFVDEITETVIERFMSDEDDNVEEDLKIELPAYCEEIIKIIRLIPLHLLSRILQTDQSTPSSKNGGFLGWIGVPIVCIVAERINRDRGGIEQWWDDFASVVSKSLHAYYAMVVRSENEMEGSDWCESKGQLFANERIWPRVFLHVLIDTSDSCTYYDSYVECLLNVLDLAVGMGVFGSSGTGVTAAGLSPGEREGGEAEEEREEEKEKEEEIDECFNEEPLVDLFSVFELFGSGFIVNGILAGLYGRYRGGGGVDCAPSGVSGGSGFLQRLSLKGCVGVQKKVLLRCVEIWGRTGMVDLDLVGVRCVDEEVLMGISKYLGGSLRRLQIGGLIELEDEIFLNFLHDLKREKHIVRDSREDYFKDIDLKRRIRSKQTTNFNQLITNTNPSSQPRDCDSPQVQVDSAVLEELNVQGCPRLTDSSLLGISENIPGIRNLCVQGNYRMTDGGILKGLGGFMSLERFNSCGCYKITENGRRYLLNTFRSIVFYNDSREF